MERRKPTCVKKNETVSDFSPSTLWVYLIAEAVLLIVLSLCGVRFLWALLITIWGAVFVALLWALFWAWRGESEP